MPLAEGELVAAQLHPALRDATMQSMTFLNEIAERYPAAVSFAPGRPYAEFFELDSVGRHLQVFLDHEASTKGLSPAELNRQMFQYGRTKGIIHEVLANALLLDEGLAVDPDSVVVTVGCQEAMLITLLALQADAASCVLAVEPTYVGIAGAAALIGMPLVPVHDGPDGIDLDHLESQIEAAVLAGRRPRALYVVPDFANPTGKVLSLDTRRRLLDIAEAHEILVLEDDPYRLFGDSSSRLPTLKALDEHRTVVHLGSLSKTVMPGVRIGYAIADQRVAHPDGSHTLLADHLAAVKSMVTVNTSPLVQAIAAGKILEHGGSLVAANEREIEIYRRNRQVLLTALEETFPPAEADRHEVTWNAPEGGFFVVLDVPFDADGDALEECAREHGVLWTPMSDFFQSGGGRRQLRLSCSTQEPPAIVEGVRRLGGYVAGRRAVPVTHHPHPRASEARSA